MLHMSLDQLRGLPGAAEREAAWPGPVTGPGADCDAAIVPMVTGAVDPVVLDRLTAALLRGSPGGTGQNGIVGQPGAAGQSGTAGQGGTAGRDRADAARRDRTVRAARQIVISAAAELLSGPGGLASWLRTGLAPGPAASPSLPLDTGTATEAIPAHLRRAVTVRDRHCRFPGCAQPPVGCQPHHLIPRSEGGPTCLGNLLLLCTFHHLIAVHRWGWGITLHPDGTVSAASPDRSRVLHSHGPPSRAA